MKATRIPFWEKQQGGPVTKIYQDQDKARLMVNPQDLIEATLPESWAEQQERQAQERREQALERSRSLGIKRMSLPTKFQHGGFDHLGASQTASSLIKGATALSYGLGLGMIAGDK